MTIYLVQYGGYDDAWVEAAFTKREDADAFCAEMNKAKNEYEGYEVVEFCLDARVGEKRAVEYRCQINVADGETPDRRVPPLVSAVNVLESEAAECESGKSVDYIFSFSTRSPEHAKELLVAEYEAWKATVRSKQ